MKRIFTTLSLATFGIAAFISCQKETPEVIDAPKNESAIMSVNADAVPTKTYIDEVSASEYNLYWSKDDAIACYEVSLVDVEGTPTETVQNKVTSSPLASSGSSASFTMDFSKNEGDAPFSYIFVYPASHYSKSNNTYRAEIPEKQTFSATSFDKNADVLISRAITGQTSRPTSVNAEFERIGATVLMNIKAPTTTEKIRSIIFSTTEGNIRGYVKVYPLSGDHENEIYSGGESITLTPADETTFSGTIPVWFRMGAITLTNNFTVVVTTNSKKYTKVVDLTSGSGRTLEFSNSGLTKFNVNMTTVSGVDNPSIDDGDYYIVAKSGDNYFGLSSTANGTRLSYQQLEGFDPTASYYITNDATLEWTVTNEGDIIYIEQGADNFLTPASKGASTGNTKKTYTLASGSTTGTLCLNSVDLSGYGLRLNVGNYFGFYNSDPTATMIADMYFMPKDPRTRVSAPTNVDADVTGTTITVIWDDAVDTNIDHYKVSLILAGTEVDSADVDCGDETCEFTGLADGNYSISVESVPANSATHLNSAPVVVDELKVGTGGTTTYTYTFTSTAWAATLNNSPANWTNDNNGTATGDSRGISIQKADSGAGATSPVSYNTISNVTMTLSKSSKGVGSVDIYVGDTKIGTQSSFSTSATAYSFDVNNLSGTVSFVVTCSTSTLYVKDIAITASGIDNGGGPTPGNTDPIVINKDTDNFPTAYGTANKFSEYTLGGYKYQIQQVYVNGTKLQWRASGNSNGTGTLYNSDAMPAGITSIVIVYDESDSNKNHTVQIGSSANPTSATTISPTTSSNTYTYVGDGTSKYFVITNGSGAGYITSITINFD